MRPGITMVKRIEYIICNRKIHFWCLNREFIYATNSVRCCLNSLVARNSVSTVFSYLRNDSSNARVSYSVESAKTVQDDPTGITKLPAAIFLSPMIVDTGILASLIIGPALNTRHTPSTPSPAKTAPSQATPPQSDDNTASSSRA